MLSYDYTVLAGTQGALGHRKKDRLFELIERMRLPTVFFAEGGGGRPGDTDYPVVSALDTRAFALWARLSGVVPRIAVVAGRCFAGNAVIAGCSDLIVATENASLGMGGPAMIEGGGLGEVDPDEVGPIDDAGAATAWSTSSSPTRPRRSRSTKRLLAYFQGATPPGAEPDQAAAARPRPRARSAAPTTVAPIDRDARRRGLGHLPARALRAGDGHRAGPDRGAPGRRHRQRHPRTWRARSPATRADKAARFMQLCDAFGLPVVSLVDTPGMMVGPEAEATGLVRHASRLLVAGAALRVPLIAVILRRGYGLGAQAMVGGSLHEPLLTVAWPTAHLGPMGLEGAVRLALRKELEAIADEDEREQRVRDLTAAAERERQGAQRRDAVRARRRDRPGRDALADRLDPGRGGLETMAAQELDLVGDDGLVLGAVVDVEVVDARGRCAARRSGRGAPRRSPVRAWRPGRPRRRRRATGSAAWPRGAPAGRGGRAASGPRPGCASASPRRSRRRGASPPRRRAR